MADYEALKIWIDKLAQRVLYVAGIEARVKKLSLGGSPKRNKTRRVYYR